MATHWDREGIQSTSSGLKDPYSRKRPYPDYGFSEPIGKRLIYPKPDQVEEIKVLHLRMIEDLSNHLHRYKHDKWKDFQRILVVYIEPKEIETVKDMTDVFSKLMECGKISYGRYLKLRRLFCWIDSPKCIGILDEYTDKMEDARKKSAEKNVRFASAYDAGAETLQYVRKTVNPFTGERRVLLAADATDEEKALLTSDEEEDLRFHPSQKLEPKYNCQIIKGMIPTKYSNLYARIHKLTREGESKDVTTVSDCLEENLDVLVVGQGTEMWTKTEMMAFCRFGSTVACLVLSIDVAKGKLTSESEPLVNLDLPYKTYWTSALDVSSITTHLISIEICIYKNLREFDREFQCEELQIYESHKDACQKVQNIFLTKQIKVKTYSGRAMSSNDLAVVVVPLECTTKDIDIEECKQECRKQHIFIQVSGEDQEDINVCKYMFSNDVHLSSAKKKKLQSVISKYTDYLMKAHTNLKAINASAIKSKQGGAEISKEECIVLYCTGKGVIPLLENPFPKKIQGCRVDIREGNFCFAGVQGFHERLLLGGSIGSAIKLTSGTLGPFVEENNMENTYPGFLTCSHVFYEFQDLIVASDILHEITPPRPQVVQPSKADKESNNINKSDQEMNCGEVRKIFFGNLKMTGNDCFGVDIALVRLHNKTRIPETIQFAESNGLYVRSTAKVIYGREKLRQKEKPGKTDLPITKNIVKKVRRSDSKKDVVKCGRTTGNTVGKLCVDADTNVKLENMHGDCGDRIFTLYKQYEVINSTTIFGRGDSGAAVYIDRKDGNHLLGVLTGGDRSGRKYYVSPIIAILRALEDNVNISNLSIPEPMDYEEYDSGYLTTNNMEQELHMNSM